MNTTILEIPVQTSFHKKFREGFVSGLEKGWKGFIWMFKVLTPISFFTLLINYFGVISYISAVIAPVLSLLNLPPIAVLPLVVGMLTGIYGGIAAMVVLPLTPEQMTLIGVFLLISHNLVQECVIQKQSGMGIVQSVVIRLTASCVTVLAIAPFLQSETLAASEVIPSGTIPSLTTLLTAWTIDTLRLTLKIFIIIMVLMILLGIMKSFDLIRYLVRWLTPFLRIIGLDQKCGILWLTAVVFGLAYGAAVILEEAKEGYLKKDELTRLHISIGINHSMVEDPLLFASLGLPIFWLWIPRLITAVAAVYLYRGWTLLTVNRSLQKKD